MAIEGLDWWYDAANRRYLLQLVRAFSGFQYRTGYNAAGPPQLLMVPCTLANTNRQVANILRNNSENSLLSAPRITVWQTGLTGRREDVQYPGFVDSLQVVERRVDAGAQKYGTDRGNAYTVQRLMPRPFQMEVQVDLWTANLDQKYQILEQILTLVYPSFDIQNSENALDWTALTTVHVEDVTLSSRSIPVGSDSDLDVASLKLRVPIWLSPPAKVKAQKIIKQIIANIFDEEGMDLDGNGTLLSGFSGPAGSLLARDVVTPGNHFIKVEGASITLLGAKAQAGAPAHGALDDGSNTDWRDLLNEYGQFRPAQSRIRLHYTDDIEGPYVSGTLQLDTQAADKLIWQIDPETIPANTLDPINALIDPLRTYPGSGLPVAGEGARYLIVSDVAGFQPWGALSAAENDIVEFRQGSWRVAFASRAVTASQLVLNQHSGSQLRWTGKEWVLSIDATYSPGYWRLIL